MVSSPSPAGGERTAFAERSRRDFIREHVTKTELRSLKEQFDTSGASSVSREGGCQNPMN